MAGVGDGGKVYPGHEQRKGHHPSLRDAESRKKNGSRPQCFLSASWGQLPRRANEFSFTVWLIHLFIRSFIHYVFIEPGKTTPKTTEIEIENCVQKRFVLSTRGQR